MPESSIVVRPEPKDSGSYTAASRLQAAGLSEAIAVFEKAAAAVPIPAPPQPIVIADYGAGTGHNSLLPIGAAIAVLRKRTRPEHSVLVAHTDRADNDFTALFRTLEEDPDSYLGKDRATFVSAVGRSFYSQILPSNSIHLGWSSWAIQWLSRVPGPVEGHLQVAYCDDESVRAAYARQAAQDWHEFIAFRGRELSPGGRLVVMTMALGDDEDFGFQPLLAAMLDALAELIGAGLVTADEAGRMCIPTVARREADFRAPFAPSGRFERLVVEQLEVFDAEDRFWARYRVDSDAAAFGAKWAGFARASAFPALASALEGGLTDPRVPEFFDRLEAGIAQRLAAAPEQTRIPLANVTLLKRPRT
ncbi:SAM dependent carboxyl methyltransferase [Mycolicibacterium chubuense NBB4]|uniref:SAM dependent carboxyl methyltransferase n=1 Tax=Mycolicibacterium chubuense (strain NBB4) TaxID=710421 RepID=I4BL79_MYCCN|nr:SAM dependent carboxyl methyltransferase [Mycolicibacterium chubuense]AFM18036.1 SAM dependent carboxyl methyltransferase [Mycolicibacterium chubuense NBB4]